MQTRIHCLIDREPASYHDQLRCAVNLNLECEGEAADEPEAERQFERFLAALPDVQFHVYVLSGSGDVQDATYVAGLEQDFDKQLAKQTAALAKAN